MFTKWIKDIVSQANNSLNSDEAKRLRKKLIVIGAILSAIGIALILAGFITFTVTSFNQTASFSSSINVGGIVAGMVMLILGGVIGGIGSFALKAGLGIVIAGVGSKIIDVNKEKKCPSCGDVIEDDEIFCNKCGADLRAKKKCSKCGNQNDFKDLYCKQCGNKLE